MKYLSCLLALLFLLINSQSCTVKPVEETTLDNIETEEALVITNVSIIPMTSNEVVDNQTIIIENGKIKALGNVSIPTGATIIDGEGKYLIPGLTEMHAHIPVAQGGDDELVKETLFLYLSQGITTIRGMLGNPYHLQLKEQVKNGTIIGPRIYTSSPSLNGNTVETSEEANKKVSQYQKDGYDFLKIHPGIQLNVWKEVERTAKSVGIPYAGHVPVEVGIHRALEAKYKTVDHMDGFIEGLVPTATDIDPNDNGFFGFGFTDLIDESLIEPLVEKMRRNEVAIVPTQTLFTRWFSPRSAAALANEPEMRYMDPKTLFTWRQSKERLINNVSYDAEKWERFINIRKKLLKTMYEKGIVFLLGSDAPQVFNVPGFSIHHELEAIAEAGIPNFEVLKSGTANPAKFFGAAGIYGTIVEGAVADLVLLDANPLEALENTHKIEGVLVKGQWLSKASIDEKLTAIAKKYSDK